MAFQGDLRNVGLATVFQNMEQNLQSGTLKVERRGAERYVYFDEGKVTMFSAGPGTETPVGDILLREGRLSSDALDMARRKKRSNQRIGTVLMRAGLAGEEDVKRAVERFLEEELHELFTWGDGRFEFTEGSPPQDIFDAEMRKAKLRMEPSAVILEAARRVDEWDRINRVLGSPGDIYVVRREKRGDLEGERDERARHVGALLDGRRDVSGVIRESGLGRFAACQALSKLITERIVRPVSPDELAAAAERAESSGELGEAVHLLKRAVEFQRSDTDLRMRLAGSLSKMGSSDEAAAEYKFVGRLHAEAGRAREACSSLRRALATMPSDVEARESLVDVLLNSADVAEAANEALELADAYLKVGLAQKARAATRKVLEANPPEPVPLQKKLAESSVALGDVAGAVGTLKEAAKRMLATRKHDEAASLYEEVLKLDSKDHEASRRLAEIQSGIVERVRERRRALIRAAVIAAVGFPVLLLVVRDLAAPRAHSEAQLAALADGMDAARALGRADALSARAFLLELGTPARTRAYLQAAEAFEAAAVAFLGAARPLELFGNEWGWTGHGRVAGSEAAYLREQAAKARMSAAEVYVRCGEFARAHGVYEGLSRDRGVPAEIARQAREKAEQWESLAHPEGSGAGGSR